jgi:NAD(P)-dependent dehydrogenase (short-subunit alcohol dehydrogenase family)
MIENGSGRIINIAGSGVRIMAVGGLAIAASKAALVGLTHALAFELGPFAITANVVSPHATNTDRARPLAEDWAARELEQIPLGRFAEPSDIADVCAFLASNAAGYITGQTINVNGGRYMA